MATCWVRSATQVIPRRLRAAKTVIGIPSRVVWNVLKPMALSVNVKYAFGGDPGISKMMPMA